MNTGSSSLKAALYTVGAYDRPAFSAKIERIGGAGGRLEILDDQGDVLADLQPDLPNHRAAWDAMIDQLGGRHLTDDLAVIGHRVVHGGPTYRDPRIISEDLIADLRALTPIDPDHLPQALDAIESAGQTFGGVPQAACFDTAFHQHMPRLATLYPLPRELHGAGVIRYGFHGLSYEYIMRELGILDRAAANGSVVIAHLGSGASMAAVQLGRSVDTTMGFSPTGGLMMGTRSGDLDPGVLFYLQEARHLGAADLSALINGQAGLLGVSGTSADMRDLLAREATDQRAKEAIDLFCYQAKKYLGALSAVLGGLDTLIFTGGIGERADPIRARICAGLRFLGIEIDPDRNRAQSPIISRDGSAVVVRVMATDEDSMIARHTDELLTRQGEINVSV
ncbi:MAG TPA: acetate/propionate family kinase [Chloroflexota bacterium]